jgi:hypothetical protein
MKSSVLVEAWRDRMSACRKSGLRVSDYCQQNGLPTRRFYYWKLRIARLDGAPHADTEHNAPLGEWLRFDPEPEAAPHRDRLTVKIAGAEIEIGADFNPTLLRAVVLALGSEQC